MRKRIENGTVSFEISEGVWTYPMPCGWFTIDNKGASWLDCEEY